MVNLLNFISSSFSIIVFGLIGATLIGIGYLAGVIYTYHNFSKLTSSLNQNRKDEES